MNKDGMPAELSSYHCYLWSYMLAWCMLKLLLSWLFKVSVLMHLKLWKTYNIVVQISLLIKLFLLVFITAAIKLIQTEAELWSESLCIVCCSLLKCF